VLIYKAMLMCFPALFKSRFFGIGGGRSEKLFESRRSRGEFFSRPRKFQKIVGFEYSLDLFGPFWINACPDFTSGPKRTVAIKNQAF
jgi:hypothetical protein